ncbi:MAG: SMC-Scp complex subunit ScpB [Ignavibacteriae bacterium]|nr:SMC-Scp complex subunit ScpB [Ignavibacteriota bacterium]
MDNIYISIIESLIFASEDAISSSELIKAIKEIDGEDTSITVSDIENSVKELNKKYEDVNSSFTVINIAEGYLFATKTEYAKYIGFLSTEKTKRRLSQAAVETLSIIAYKQPITKPEIETIRGVNSDYMINTLLEKSLVTIKGRADTMGRPLIYGTTPDFLMYFGLNKISDLPKPREIEEIMRDEDFLEQKRKIMMNEIEENLENDVDSMENDIIDSGSLDSSIE